MKYIAEFKTEKLKIKHSQALQTSPKSVSMINGSKLSYFS